VTIQSLGCIAVFGKPFWKALLAMTPSIAFFQSACKAVGIADSQDCTLPAVLDMGRSKAMIKFSMQHRMLPGEMLGGRQLIDEATLVDKFCGVLSVCGAKSSIGLGYEKTDKYNEMVEVVARVMAALDTNGDRSLSLDEIAPVVGTSDGKLSLAGLDPGTGGVLSFGMLWNLFIAGLVCFFVYSIVEQVGLQTQIGKDGDELAALEASLSATTPKPKSTAKKQKKD